MWDADETIRDPATRGVLRDANGDLLVRLTGLPPSVVTGDELSPKVSAADIGDLTRAVAAFGAPRRGVFLACDGRDFTGAGSSGSATIQAAGSTAGLRLGQQVTGPGVQAGSYIAGLTGPGGSPANTVTLSKPLNATNASATFCAIRDYTLIRGVADGRYEQISLVRYTGAPGGYGLNQLRTWSVGLPMTTVGTASGAGMTSSGTWTAITGQPSPAKGGSFENRYIYATAWGAYRERTTGTTTGVGMRVCFANNGGLTLVSIDGDKTRANRLPTAQDMVDAGLYPNTILTANGGSLAPTDRVINHYNTLADDEVIYDLRLVLADDLPSGSHVVRTTAVGATPTGASAPGRSYITGFGEVSAAAITDPAVALYTSDWLTHFKIGSAYEYAIEQRTGPSGTWTWLGNIHGYETQRSLALRVDGVETDPVPGTVVQAANEITLVRDSWMRHPDLDAGTVVCDALTTYRCDRDGLTVDPVLTWRVAVTVRNGYFGMMPLNAANNPNGRMDRAALLRTPTVIELAGGADTYRGFSRSQAGWMWSSTGRVAALGRMLDIDGYTEGWSHTTLGTRVQDRGTGSPPTSKLYFPWVTGAPNDLAAPNRDVAAGEAKRGTFRLTARFAAAGINSAMAEL